MAENNTSATHYETLGVPKTASHDEIKKSFRKLSMKYHPDRKTEDSCAEKFKAIANAHSVLSTPVERKEYDRKLAEDLLWNKNRNAWGNNRRQRPPKPTGHVVMETLTNPRYAAMGIMAVGGVALLGSLLGSVTGKRPEYHPHGAQLVEAWKNPATGRYGTFYCTRWVDDFRYKYMGLTSAWWCLVGQSAKIGFPGIQKILKLFLVVSIFHPVESHIDAFGSVLFDGAGEEQPAPWDKEYQRLRPKLEMVPREKVWKRHM